MKYLLSAFILIALCGCAAETKTYGSGFGKHPIFLVVKPDGSYLIEQHFKYTIHETGRWWELEETLLALLPDDPTKQASFARVGPDDGLHRYVLYPDLRSAIDTDKAIGTMPASLADELANESVHGLYQR